MVCCPLLWVHLQHFEEAQGVRAVTWEREPGVGAGSDPRSALLPSL